MNKDEITATFNRYSDMIDAIIYTKFKYRVNNDYDDMYQIGSEALLNAIKHYNKESGTTESTYYYTSIYNALKHLGYYIDNMSTNRNGNIFKITRLIHDNPDMSANELSNVSGYDEIEALSYKIA